MSAKHEAGGTLKKLWDRFDEDERRLILYLVHATPPVLIDTLSGLAGIPAVKVLNVMEKLKKKKIAHEKKEYGKGAYFPGNSGISDFVQRHISREETEKILKNLVRFYRQSLADDNEKILVLAELYRRFGDNGEGLAYIKNAADLLCAAGQRDKAIPYYVYLLENFPKEDAAGINAGNLLEGTLEKLSAAGYLLPIQERISLLIKAQEAAGRLGKSDYVANIKLALGQILKEAGQHEEASEYFNDFLNVAGGIDDQPMLRTAALSISDIFFWQGRISEAVRRYEKVVGHLEEFGNDEIALKTSAMLGSCHVICGRISRGMGMIGAVRSKADSLGFQNVVSYADLMSAMSLIEIRNAEKADPYIQRILSLPEEGLDHYVLCAANACMAYIHCAREEYEEAFVCQKKVIHYSRMLGSIHHRGSHILECIYELEKKGFHLEEMNYNAEIKRMLDGDNIYMKGIAFRCRAAEFIKKRESKGRAFLDLKNSEKYLEQAGAEIELARTRIALGDAFLKEGEINVAQSYLEKAWALLSKVEKGLFPKDLRVIMMPQEQKVEFIIDRIIDINESLGTIRDMSSFLERVLNITMDFTMAMRGAFFIIEPEGGPKIIASRNLDPLMLKVEQFNLIREMIEDVVRQGTEAIMPGLKSRGTVSGAAIKEAGITSLICMPASLGDNTHGYLYLDNRLGGIPFSDNQIPYVRLICNQIAVGLTNIRIYEEMKELKNRFEDEAIFYKREMGIVNTQEMIIGTSKEIEAVLEQIRQVAPTDSSVLIMGETGVGKELVAKAIHNLSKRKDGPFIPVNLAALPQELVASELFGHEKGAFTGAHEKNKGRFELASGGTLFLDEIGDMPLTVQVKLLRVLQEGFFERLGSGKQIKSDFRVIAATNKDLSLEVEKGLFRQDLYYRLNVFPIYIPPLRERKEDILLIASHFINKFSRQMRKRIRRKANGGLKKLTEYNWPGNVRELEHFIERAIILSDGEKLNFSGLDHAYSHPAPGDDPASVSLSDMEREHIRKVLKGTHWKISGPNGAASILGLKPTTLISRMKKLGIRKPAPAAFFR